ncbi:MAG TPA: hypothetical protein VNO43_18895 [Candidatus Eisenbacteria bacterium]|nr:hypothetical protein [Candidatus Eisenbacteria bacterium]
MVFWHALTLLLHLAGLALWLGGIAFFLIVFAPAARDLTPATAARTLNSGRIAFETLSWTAIGLLTVTGIVALILQSQITGARVGTYYLTVLSVKLVLFAAMLAHHCLQVLKYGPRISMTMAEVDAESAVWPEALRAAWEKWFFLLKINGALGPIVTLLGLALVRS